MQTVVLVQALEEIDVDALVVVAFDKDSAPGGWGDGAARRADATTGWLSELYATGEFKGKSLETALLHRPPGFKARRLLAIGGGKAGKLTACEVRKIAGAALRGLKPKGIHTMALALDSAFAGAGPVAAAVEGALLADYEPDRYKTDKSEAGRIDTFSLVVPAMDAAIEAAARRATIVAESQNYTRALAAEPGNAMTPTVLADRARALAAEQGLDCEVLDRARMEQLGMGALLGVAQGSHEPPCLILLRYRPEGEVGAGAHLALVGKAVTFDSGGISIKPSDKMDLMKFDMSGGAAVLGAMRAIAQLKPALTVTALVPAVENMPGSRAQRPGDIVTTLSGKTVEVLNTDAEGRLILADAMTYARNLGCTHLVDAATLTGAIVVALGNVYTGLFPSEDAFGARVASAAEAAGEKMWRMPVDDEYKEALKSAYADLPNIGNRMGGAITAAMFLKEFTGDAPWVHLDIAGTAWLDEAKPFLAKGPSGVAVRTLVNLVASWNG
jgi:leucyl aminopeptidase